MSNSSIWPIDMTLSGATTPGQSGPGSDGNEGVLRIPQNSSITGASLSDCLVSHPEHSWEKSYSSIEMQVIYSTAPADWAICKWDLQTGKLFLLYHVIFRMKIINFKCVIFITMGFPSIDRNYKHHLPKQQVPSPKLYLIIEYKGGSL